MAYEFEFKISPFTGIIYVLALHIISPLQKNVGYKKAKSYYFTKQTLFASIGINIARGTTDPGCWTWTISAAETNTNTKY